MATQRVWRAIKLILFVCVSTCSTWVCYRVFALGPRSVVALWWGLLAVMITYDAKRYE